MISNEVVRRFCQKELISHEEGDYLFGRLEKFLDSAAKGNGACPTPEVDKAWHHFILDTKEYMNFCRNRYGVFIHHIPEGTQCSSAISEMISEGDCNPGIEYCNYV